VNFLHLKDHSPEVLQYIVDEAIAFKQGKNAGTPLAGKGVGLCFMNPSLRTQTAFSIAAAQLGAHPVVLNFGGNTWKMESRDGVLMDGDCAEHLKEAVPVLSSYCSILGLRSFPDGKNWEEDKLEPALAAFKKYATVPVVNLESATGHPSQGLADWMTIQESIKPKGKKFVLAWAPHTKALPMAVPNSAVEAAALAKMNITIARPEGYDLPPETMAHLQSLGATVEVTSDTDAAYKNADVIYAKSWGELSSYGTVCPQDSAFRNKWTVDEAKMAKTNDALFMHCLPVRRNLVVADSVIDGPTSKVLQQAENRLHTAKAMLSFLAATRTSSTTPSELSYA